MCGICGQFNYKRFEPVLPETIERMSKTLVHRGPDDEGHYISGPIGFGFRRLSIIDLEGGHQPMADKEKRIWVVFNGEIYNFPVLKKELENHGHVFRTRSDTEVLVYGYKQWGEEVFNHLNGMFGVAIWDGSKQKLILARDPMGIKLVYYLEEKDTIYFGSEIRPILAAIQRIPDIDPVSLNLFLRYRYSPSPVTIYEGIRKLAPGTMLVLENGKSRLERWYKYRPEPFSPPMTEKRAKDELLELYRRAVKRHLISDVPVGLLLSGGVDSGLLLGLMNRYGKDWPTYTVGYGNVFKDDELDHAAETARLFSSHHAMVELNRDIFQRTLPKIISFLEEPIASSSIVPMYFVCERARKDVKVALVGQGPDELFGGYTRHLGIRYGSYWRDLPEWIKAPMKDFINTLPRNEALKRGVYALDIPDQMKRYQYSFSILPGELIDGLFHPGLLPSDAGDRVLACWEDLKNSMVDYDELGGFQLLEIRSSLPDELLMYSDKLSMAHGLEIRVPYLDREVVEYVARLPANFKIRWGIRKWLHRQVCKDFLPTTILNRKKRGFAVNVVDDWFRNSFDHKTEELLLDPESYLYKYLNYGSVAKLLNDHKLGRHDNHKILFSLLLFEEWLRCNLSSTTNV